MPSVTDSSVPFSLGSFQGQRGRNGKPLPLTPLSLAASAIFPQSRRPKLTLVCAFILSQLDYCNSLLWLVHFG